MVQEIEPFPHPYMTDVMSAKLRRPSEGSPSLESDDWEVISKHFDEVDPKITGGISKGVQELLQNALLFCREHLLLISENDYDGNILQSPLPPKLNKNDIDARLASRGEPRLLGKSAVMRAIWSTVAQDESQSRSDGASLYVTDDYLQTNAMIYFDYRSWLEKVGKFKSGKIKENPGECPHSDQTIEALYSNNTYHSIIFTVDKTDLCNLEECDIIKEHYLQRIIIDGRIANAHLQNPAYLDIFRLESLFDAFSRCREEAEKQARKFMVDQSEKIEKKQLKPGSAKQVKTSFYTVSADLRHWFHQIPMPRRFRSAYAVYLKTPEGKLRVVFPRTWPMGASPAPGIGQAVTWSMLLTTLDTETDTRVGLGIDWPEERKFDVYLPWLPLKCGGGVFVLLDNIFVVTANKSYALSWKSRIEYVTNKFHAELKQQKAHNNEKIIVVELSKGSGTVSHFTGINFSFEGRVQSHAVNKIDAFDLSDDQQQPSSFKCSYRKLASIIGQCLWVYRIRGRHPRKCKVYKKVAPIAYPKGGATWKDEVTITGEELENLITMYRSCSSPTVTSHPPPLALETNNFAILATDASFANGIAQRGFAYSFPSTVNNPFRYRGKPETRKDGHIAIEELRAVLEALQHMKENSSSFHPFPQLIMLAIDSTHAKGMIMSGIAKSNEANELLDQLYDVLGDSRLHMTHVPSLKNPADALSRQELEWQQQLWDELSEEQEMLVPLVTAKMREQGSRIRIKKDSRTNKFQEHKELDQLAGSRRDRE